MQFIINFSVFLSEKEDMTTISFMFRVKTFEVPQEWMCSLNDKLGFTPVEMRAVLFHSLKDIFFAIFIFDIKTLVQLHNLVGVPLYSFASIILDVNFNKVSPRK